MKKSFIVLSAIILLSGIAVAKEKQQHQNDVARRGCCSHHGGVCGCSQGRAVCCDGTYSPTCGCDKHEEQQDKLLNVQKGVKG
jgi:predicted transporter